MKERRKETRIHSLDGIFCFDEIGELEAGRKTDVIVARAIGLKWPGPRAFNIPGAWGADYTYMNNKKPERQVRVPDYSTKSIRADDLISFMIEREEWSEDDRKKYVTPLEICKEVLHRIL